MDHTTLQDVTQLVTAIGVVLGLITSLVVAIRQGRVEAKTDAVHGLVNGQMNHVLKSNAALAEKVAKYTGNVEDERIAKEAKSAFADHAITAAAVVKARPEVVRPTLVEEVKEGEGLKEEKITKG